MKVLFPAAATIAMAVAVMQLGRWIPAFDVVNTAAPGVIVLALTVAAFAIVARRPGTFVMAALATAGSAERVVSEVSGFEASAPATVGAETVSVLTFNVWHDNPDPAAAADTILQSGADVVLLQEAGALLRTQGARLERAYPYRSDCPRGTCDVAILSRLPLDRPRYRFRSGAGAAIGPGLATARVILPGGAFSVASLHAPRPTEQADGDDAWRFGLARAVGEVGDPALVLAGDFNLTPWSFAMQRLDRAMGPVRRVTRARFTYRSAIPALADLPFLPIDHAFAGPAWRVVSVRVLTSGASDHLPVLIELQRRPLAAN